MKEALGVGGKRRVYERVFDENGRINGIEKFIMNSRNIKNISVV